VSERRAEQLAMLAILAAALLLRTWGLQQNGWGAEYYSAAVRSMASNWHNFLYASFDPSGFISVDKPPLALWLQVASAKLFGFRPLALLLPQALAGVAAVAVLYHLGRRTFGAAPALVAAFLLALTPVWVAVNRTNNTDSLLLLVLLLAAWALLAASETGSRRLLLVAMTAIGIAFNVKMLAGFVVLPAFAATYVWGDLTRWRRRVADLALGAVVMLVVALPWVLAYQLEPPSARPFVGSSRDNKMSSLVLGHNALGRFVRTEGSQPSARDTSAVPLAAAREQTPADDLGDDDGASARALARRLFVRSPTGPLRVFDGQLAAQFAWWLPLAIAGVILGLRRLAHAGDEREIARQRNRKLAIVFWSLWAVTYALVYGYLGGIVHYYYLSTLAPALAVLAGIGIVLLCERLQEERYGRAALALTIVATCSWQFLVHARALGWAIKSLWSVPETWLIGLQGAVAAAAATAALILAFAPRRRRHRRLDMAALAVASVSLVALPLAWALSSVLLPGQGTVPSADLYRLLVATRAPGAIETTRFGQAPDTTKLVAFLEAQRAGEAFLVATTTTRLAAPIIINTGEPVMARGGFHGLDATFTPNSFSQLVREGKIRFAIVGDTTAANRALGSEAAGKPIADWIQANGRRVDGSLWRGAGMARSVRLYDLRPPGEAPV
jgi:4-amino-4-deoxy-L-arabinose transferase-like glycosyltransferase